MLRKSRDPTDNSSSILRAVHCKRPWMLNCGGPELWGSLVRALADAPEDTLELDKPRLRACQVTPHPTLS